jgi:hypothetical protein
MTDVPLALQQLIQMTAGELGLGQADLNALSLAILRAYKIGVQDERSRNSKESPGGNGNTSI